MRGKNMKKDELCTALISDTLIDMGCENQMLPVGFKPTFEEAKIFGKVRTMLLKEIEEKDDYKDIYKGIRFLEEMNPDEILLVANGFDNMAFFGELMSTVAIKNKLQGAVIDGVTRDRQPTRDLKFPVFAKGAYAKDLRNKAIVEKTDGKVKIGAVSISSGDYLFGDSDGIVIIPKELYYETMKKVTSLLETEKEVKKLVEKGASVEEISRKCGNF
jgi:regulator of RNase E activity RraA